MNKIILAHELQSPFSRIPTNLVRSFYEEVLDDYEDLCNLSQQREKVAFPIDPHLEGEGLFRFFMDRVAGQVVEKNYQEWVLNHLMPGDDAETEAQIAGDCQHDEYNENRWCLIRDVKFAMLYLRLPFITEKDVWLNHTWEKQFLHTSQYMEYDGNHIWNPPHRGVW